MTTCSEKVKIFTEESTGNPVPTHPRCMTREEVLFVVKMNVEELQELLLTITDEDECTKELLIDIVKKSQLPTVKPLNTDVDYVKEQVDAFVDIHYYNCNAAAKVGFNVDQVFDVVHEANMSKKFDDGTFHRNDADKVIKPPNWQEPDTDPVINSWFTNGTWSS